MSCLDFLFYFVTPFLACATCLVLLPADQVQLCPLVFSIFPNHPSVHLSPDFFSVLCLLFISAQLCVCVFWFIFAISFNFTFAFVVLYSGSTLCLAHGCDMTPTGFSSVHIIFIFIVSQTLFTSMFSTPCWATLTHHC